jgi:hypothetical protein
MTAGPAERLPVGTLVIAGSGIGRIHKVGSIVPGCPGYWVMAPTGDPGQDWAHPSFTQTVRPAVVGETVCVNPSFRECLCRCWCGLTHVTREQMAWLPTAATDATLERAA